MNENDLYCLVLEAILEEAEVNEASTMAGGAVGGVSVPLGAGPSGRVTYRDGNDKSNAALTQRKPKPKKKKGKKKKKVYTRSVQHYLKHGGEKTRKRSFK